MGKTEQLIGGIIIALVLVRLIFYVSFLDTLIALLTLVLSLIYLTLSFALLNNVRLRTIFKKTSYENIGVLRIIGAIGTGFALSLICIYSLFKFMRWSFGNLELSILLLPLTIASIIASLKFLTTKNKFYSNFLKRLLIFGVIGTIFFFVPTQQILEIKNRNFPDYIEAEKQLMRDPENKELQQKVFEERQKKNSAN